MRSVYLHKDKAIFQLDKLPAERFATSLGLPGAPKIKFLAKDAASKKKNENRDVAAVKKETVGAARSSEAGATEVSDSGSEDEGDEDDGGSESEHDASTKGAEEKSEAAKGKVSPINIYAGSRA